MAKIFYALGGLMVGGGIAAYVLGSHFLGAVISALGVVTLIVTFFVKNLVEAGGNPIPSVPESNKSVEMKINQAISSARQNKFKAESEIRRLTAWSNDAIFTTYQPEFEKVSANYNKEELLDNYSEIREKFGADLSFETMEKCDGIVKDYSQKISGYKSRIGLFEKQEEEYIALKEKIKAVKQHEKMMNKLQAHDQKIENATDKESLSIVAGDDDINQLTLSSIEKEVAEKEEYFKQLDQINYQLKQ